MFKIFYREDKGEMKKLIKWTMLVVFSFAFAVGAYAGVDTSNLDLSNPRIAAKVQQMMEAKFAIEALQEEYQLKGRLNKAEMAAYEEFQTTYNKLNYQFQIRQLNNRFAEAEENERKLKDFYDNSPEGKRAVNEMLHHAAQAKLIKSRMQLEDVRDQEAFVQAYKTRDSITANPANPYWDYQTQFKDAEYDDIYEMARNYAAAYDKGALEMDGLLIRSKNYGWFEQGAELMFNQ
jgi:hypothetical protein